MTQENSFWTVTDESRDTSYKLALLPSFGKVENMKSGSKSSAGVPSRDHFWSDSPIPSNGITTAGPLGRQY